VTTTTLPKAELAGFLTSMAGYGALWNVGVNDGRDMADYVPMGLLCC
jgi:hypothetical protein